VIRISLTLSGPLRIHYRGRPYPKTETVVLARGDCVNDLMNHYEISPEKVHMILVNRLKAGAETRLKDGDHVWLVPLAAGG